MKCEDCYYWELFKIEKKTICDCILGLCHRYPPKFISDNMSFVYIRDRIVCVIDYAEGPGKKKEYLRTMWSCPIGSRDREISTKNAQHRPRFEPDPVLIARFTCKNSADKRFFDTNVSKNI